VGVAERGDIIEKAVGRGKVMLGGVRGRIGPLLWHRKARTQLLGSISSLRERLG
jgi:hypothetical protein